MIAPNLIPNITKEDKLLALKNICWSFSWKEGRAINQLEEKFKEYFKVPCAFSFNSGRSALFVGLQALNLPRGSEILLQAFSCVVVANSIKAAGLKPIFVDIAKNSFSLDLKDLQKKITSETKAILLQNLFGYPDEMEKIQAIAQKNKLIIIEDCAQALGATCKRKKLGLFGQFAFFSFGRDKVISATFGGMLITRNKDLAEEIKKIYRNLAYPDNFWTFKQLLHPLAFSLILPAYFLLRIGKFSLGKGILFLLQKSGLLDLPVKESEKQGVMSSDYPKKLPNALALLALNQFKKLNQFNRKRIKIAQYYYQRLAHINLVQLFRFSKLKQPIFLRFPLMVKNNQALHRFSKDKGIILGNWYDQVIAPKGTNLLKIGYPKGSCPKAEELTKIIINLPTYPKMTPSDARRVIDCLLEFFKKENEN